MDETIHRLSAALARRTESPSAVSSPASPAAVLIPLFKHERAWHVLFTRRTETVESHRGQVSFPGGRIEEDDRDSIHAALREAEEEIGLRPEDVQVLGCMAPLLTNSEYWVTPVVGVIPWPYSFRTNPVEVATVFDIPLDWLIDASNRETRDWHRPETGDWHKVIFFQPFGGEVVWGITARITVDLLALLECP